MAGRKKRSEAQVLFQEATITLGGEPHTLAVRSMKDTREWREQLGTMLAPHLGAVVRESQVAVENGAAEVDMVSALEAALPGIMGKGAEDIIDLLYAYAPDDMKEAIDAASDGERFDAALEVFALAVPFVLKMAKIGLRLMTASQA